MGKIIRRAIEKRRQYLIEQLIGMGYYKKGDNQLFELTLTDLEEEYEKISGTK
ncbi:Fur-regulated basic protein FbpA [Neobacillus sp. LXY-4]|uniref:Fur-regulated basic protein FbpA n=1 Tax=Neobacillus sp. LXY-4 TaxID=3379826 RepID=UPI003EDFD401